MQILYKVMRIMTVFAIASAVIAAPLQDSGDITAPIQGSANIQCPPGDSDCFIL
jgi:hypothetical protein